MQDSTSGTDDKRAPGVGLIRRPERSLVPAMSATEYAQFVEAVHAQRKLIAIDRVFAKKLFTTVPMDTMGQTIGEVPYFEKGIVCCAVFASPVLLIGGIALGAFGLQWWMLVVAPISVALWLGNRARSKVDDVGIWGFTILLVAAVVVGFLGLFPNAWVSGGLVAFLLALWCDRLIYVASTGFLRTLVLRNQRALQAYADGLAIRNAA